MSAIESHIRELAAFAENKGGEDKTVLFRNLIDLFLTGKAPGRSPARRQLIDVIAALIPAVDTQARRTVAELMASMAEPPMDLVMALAIDRADVVGTLLRSAPFDEDQLVELIARTGREHHKDISSREDLSANVWIALARSAASGLMPTAHTNSAETEHPSNAYAGAASGNVTLLHPGLAGGEAGDSYDGSRFAKQHEAGGGDANQARLRILRTDEDLLAERVGNNREGTGETATRHSAPSLNESAESGKKGDLYRPMVDPGPGGWSWRSDRDGFVTAVSPFAATVMGRAQNRLVGEAMFDLLALNNKLDHPIARGLQRRSTLHDAPIMLTGLQKAYRYWTLEATPLFSENTGVFEGYEGVMTPVTAPPATEEEPEVFELDDPFLPDNKPSGHGAKAAEVAPNQTPPAPENAPEALKQASPKRQGSPLDDLSNMVSKQVEDHVLGVLAKAFEGANPAAAPRKPVDAKRAEAESARPPHQPAKSAATVTDQTATTPLPEKPNEAASDRESLQVLKDTVGMLVAKSRKKGGRTMRLQAEIAAACLRVLEEELDERPEEE